MPNPTSNNKSSIIIKGARLHNLKNISISIPRNKLIVITGLSGSGKSSLAFDTLFAEGQRRYIESLSSYARQFLGKINKPDVDYIEGIPPAIAIEQRVNTRNPRSTVGTSTEIYDYLKLLFARIGKTFSPVSNNEVSKDSVSDVINHIVRDFNGTNITILSPLEKGDYNNTKQQIETLRLQGFTRLELDGKIVKLSDTIFTKEKFEKIMTIHLIIDRIQVEKDDDDTFARLADSLQTAYYEGRGTCVIQSYHHDTRKYTFFSNRFELDGIKFEEPSIHLFSFNNPLGACKICQGFGLTLGIDECLVIPDKSLSVFEGAIACWKGEKMQEWKDALVFAASKYDFPVHKPYYHLSEDQKELLWTGNKHFKGLNSFFRMLEEENYKIQYRVMQSRYRGKTICPDCKGSRLVKEASYVKICNKSICDLVLLPIIDLIHFFEELNLSAQEEEISGRILIEIRNRLSFLLEVGLGYLTLNRVSSSLSVGESQRINLATSLGSSLVGSLYILDEPSIGLHGRDTFRLITILKKLNELGNTVIVVEHDEEIIRAADFIIDMGPNAGARGGEIIFQGNYKELTDTKSLSQNHGFTASYFSGIDSIPVPPKRRHWNNSIELFGARENNLKNISVRFPLQVMTVVTGVSGSGKSSLINKILFPALRNQMGDFSDKPGAYDKIQGDIQTITQVELVDQHPIGKSSRSNPVTYLKAFDEIRKLFSEQPYALMNGYKSSHFSFNIDGGRCEECKGDGTIDIEMQFMADVTLLCESCKGKRFKEDILEVKYRGKNIFDILNLTVDEAIDFFKEAKGSLERRIVTRLAPLQDVGIGYLKLGQSSSTLSGGESQRVKLASFLVKEKRYPGLFIFDEPSVGLHIHDIKSLLKAFNALLDRGHSIIVIEHNPEIIKSADWVIDLGPDGGNAGGQVIFQGTPEGLILCKDSITGTFLAPKMQQ